MVLALKLLVLSIKEMQFSVEFRSGSMRVVSGQVKDEFRIEILNLADGVKTWRYLQTIIGRDNVLAYIAEQNAKQAAVLIKWRPKK